MDDDSDTRGRRSPWRWAGMLLLVVTLGPGSYVAKAAVMEPDSWLGRGDVQVVATLILWLTTFSGCWLVLRGRPRWPRRTRRPD